MFVVTGRVDEFSCGDLLATRFRLAEIVGEKLEMFVQIDGNVPPLGSTCCWFE